MERYAAVKERAERKRDRASGGSLLVTIGKPIVSAGLIYWILRDTALSEVLAAVRAAHLPLLLFAFSLNFVGQFICTHRWRLLLGAQGVEVPLRYLLKSYIVGIFFNNFLPSTIGGDTSRAYDSRRLVKNRASAVAVLFIDRFLGLLALMIFALSTLILSRQTIVDVPYLSYWLALAVAGMAFVMWLVFLPSPSVSRLIRHKRLPVLQGLQDTVVNAFLAFQDRRDVLVRALGISLLLQANVVVHYYLIAQALDLSVPLVDFFLIIPLAIFLMLIPISINAIGVRENVFAFFLAGFGILKPEAIAFAWLAYGLILAQGILGGIIYAFRR